MRSRGRARARANYGAGSKKHEPGREMSPALLVILNHPIRREILRLLQGQAELSPSQMAITIEAGLPNLSFHARALEERNVTRCIRTRRVRGATEHFYASNVTENSLVATILSSTREDDAFLRR